MGCSSCSSGGGLPGGCKNNGACGTYGCNKLEVFDWLSGIPLPDNQKPFDIVEVRFKNNRKGFYRIQSGMEVYTGDVVTVEVSPGYDVGVVSLTGELVRTQMKRKEVKDNYEIKKVLHKSKDNEISKWQEVRSLEQDTMMHARTIAQSLNLQMKISDVEYQGDKSKATFYYTADDRVDFRELIKKFAEDFRVKIEMRQIGYRYEAAKLGGIGSCGRELCCSSWLTDFRAVSTSAARYQQLSLNPAKLAGQCGKLKCCLNYELDQYVEALREFPSVSTRLRLPKGEAVHFKTDIFKQVMFFIYEGQPGEAPFPLHTSAVKEIIEQNRKGIAIEDLDEFLEEEVVEVGTDFAQVVGQDSLTRFDRKRTGGKSGKRKPSRGRGPEKRNDKVEAKQPQQKDRPERGNRPEKQRNDRPQQERSAKQQNRPQGENKPGGELKPKELKGPQQGNPNPNQEGKPVDKNRGNRNNRHRNPNNKGKQDGNSNAPKPEQP
jgi:cell fate regulator YaaT (PSP1 superfamily)